MDANGNYLSGINGNGSEVSEFRSPEMGLGVGKKSWEWEGMVCQKLFPHISNTDRRIFGALLNRFEHIKLLK